MEPTPHLPGKFVWFEHFSSDVPRARRFYEALLGWHVEAMPVGDQSYSMILCGNQGIGGFRSTPPEVPGHWFSYLSVEDVDRSCAAALAAGASSTLAPMDFGPIGRAAGIKDPTGAILALWKGAQGDRPDTDQTAVGDWVWNELTTSDEHKALAFYERVFGYTHATMEMAAGGTYYLLKTGEKMRGGLMRLPMPEAPTAWQPYVRVADCDATAAQGQALGAKLIVPPTDIPEVGRFAILLDPLGAAIAVMTMLPR